jgi:Protein of unknown function (DUF2586)
MTLARVRVRPVDGGLRASRTTTRPPAVVACSSAGTAAAPVLVSSTEDCVAAFGYGKLTDQVALYLDLAGVPVLACKAETVTAGAAGSVSQTGTGTATMAVSTGTSADDYAVKVKVTRAGATLVAATAAVKVSLDGGTTWGPELAVPTSGVLALPKSALTVTFTYSSGTAFVVDDVYSFDATAPLWDATTLAAALDALETSTVDHEFVHVVEKVTRTTAQTVKDSLASLEALGIYRRALLSARDQNSGESVSTWLTAISAGSPGFALFDGQYWLDVVASHIDVRYRVSAGIFRRNASMVIGPRLAWMRTRVDEAFRGLAEHPGQTEVDGRDWSIPGVEALHHDVRALPTLDTARFMGLQTHLGRAGFYPTDRTMALATSDFATVMNARVIVEGATVAQGLLTTFVGRRQRLGAGGTIDERDAEALDSKLTADFFDAMSPYCTSASCTSDRASDIEHGALDGAIRVRPFGYSTDIDFSLGLTSE